MSLGLYESRLYDRRRKRLRVLKWLLVIGGLSAAGVFAYETGSTLAQVEVDQLQEQIGELTKTTETLRQRTAELELIAKSAKLAENEWRRRFQEVQSKTPKGDAKRLFDLIERQLGEGVAPNRLAFVIETTSRKPSCDGKPATKRFLVRTPLYQGANDTVSFADNGIVITSEGEPTVNAEGKPEAWFDPAKPITVKFVSLGGTTSVASGMLPLHHSVVIGENEYRFTLVASESKGFINVTGDRCQFP